MRFHRLFEERENQRLRIERIQTSVVESMVKLGTALQVNTTIGEENQRMKEAIAMEIGGDWPTFGHDAINGACSDSSWESSFRTLAQSTKQALLGFQTSMYDDAHNLFTLHGERAEVDSVHCATDGNSHACSSNFLRNSGTEPDPSPRESVTEVPDRPLRNSNPRPMRILPPEATTITMTNIPARLSPEDLLKVWPPDGTYNLMYIPYSIRRKSRCGIAIINMTSHVAAVEFMAKWQGHTLVPNMRGRSCLDMKPARIQGFMNNLLHLKSSKVDRLQKEERLPLVFMGTRKLDVKALLAHVGNDNFREDQMESYVVEPAVG